MPNKQSGGGSPFARYSGEQVNQIPEGYVQAMGQSPFANLVNSALSSYSTFRKLKTDETAAQAASKKADNEARSLTLKENKEAGNSTAAEIKSLLETNSALSNAIQRATEELKDDDKKAASDPTKMSPDMRAAKQKEIDDARFNSQYLIREAVRRQMPSTPNTFGQRTAQPGGMTPPPLIARPGQNFNSAPAGQQTDGGASDDNVDNLENPQSEQDASPTGAEKPASGEPSPTGANVPSQGLPQLLKGDFEEEIIPSKIIANKQSGKQWAANVVVNDQGVIRITHNPDATDPDKNSPDILQSNIQQYRVAHLVKYILDHNLERNVKLSPQEFSLSANYSTPENSPIWYRVQKAYVLATRNLNNNTGVFDIDETVFSKSFGTAKGYSPSDYFHGGSPDMTDLVRQQSRSIEADQAKKKELEKTVGTLLGDVARTQSQVLNYDDPYAVRRAEMLSQAEELRGKIRRSIGDSEAQTSYTNQLKALEAEIKIVADQSQAWQDRKKAQAAANETSLRVVELVTKSMTPTTGGMTDLTTQKEIGEAAKSYVGAIYGEDSSLYGGYISAGLKSIPLQHSGSAVRFREIKNSFGQSVVDRMDIPEFVSWAAIHAPHHLVRYAAFQPDKESRAAALEETRVFNMSKTPIKSLFAVLNKGPGVIDKLFDPAVGEAATVQRNNLIASFRKALIGVGNPSNFEQEIMRDIIPDPGQFFAITAKSIAKMRGIAFMTVLTHHNKMKQHGFEMTQESLDMYNDAVSDVLGRKLTMDEFNSITGYWEGLKAQHVTGGYIPGVTSIDPKSSRETLNQFSSFVEEVVNRKTSK